MSATSSTSTVELVALSDVEQNVIVNALRDRASTDSIDSKTAETLADRLQFGPEYVNELDEFVRLTIRKQLIEAAKRKTTGRLAELEAQILEDFATNGESGRRHAATGTLVSTARRIWARVAREGDEATDAERERAADALIAADLGDYVQRGFNVNSLSAYFRELAQAHDEAQRELPEDQRTPLDVDQLLPEQLRGAIELTDQPTLSVIGAKSR